MEKKKYDLEFTGTLDDRNRLTIPKNLIDIMTVGKGDKLRLKILEAYKEGS